MVSGCLRVTSANVGSLLGIRLEVVWKLFGG
jgi:hypothetical protein